MSIEDAIMGGIVFKGKKDKPKEEEKADHTPSGEWVHRAEMLYGRLSSRCDVRQWKELFQDDIYVSLDTNEECQKKLLIFQMINIKEVSNKWDFLKI